MLRKILAISLIVFFTTTGWANAEPLKARVSLWAISSEKTAESGDDEIYIGIARYEKNNLQYFYRVPEAPMHLLSRYFDRVNDLLLWHGEIQPDETVHLGFSIMEEDYPPWDLDEQLLMVKLALTIKDGKINAQWLTKNGEPLKLETVTVKEVPVQRLSFSAEGGSYTLDFLVDLEDKEAA